MKRVLVTCAEAAKVLGVDRITVKKWVQSGRLEGTVRWRKVYKEETLVRLSSLKNRSLPFQAKCLWCGKKFRAKRPEKAKYCCQRHKELAIYARKRRSGRR